MVDEERCSAQDGVFAYLPGRWEELVMTVASAGHVVTVIASSLAAAAAAAVAWAGRRVVGLIFG